MNHDEWYNIWTKSHSSNACMIRITNKCNQKCEHCCFRSHPKCVGQMSVGMCEKINSWIPRNIAINIMGGEFTILSNYPEMLVSLTKNRSRIRLVTNGYWLRNQDKFFDTIQQIKNAKCSHITVAVSTDQWHQKHAHDAIVLLKELPDIFVETCDKLPTNGLAPVGRAWDNNLRSKLDYVRACTQLSYVIITEDGMISRCPFGYFPWKHFSETTWHDAQEYVWGWRSEKLAEGMNCNLCMETEKAARSRQNRCNQK